MLGEPNPVLTVDEDGFITEKSINVYVRAYDPTANNGAGAFVGGLLDVTDSLGQPVQIGAGHWIVVGDLAYDRGARARFEANEGDGFNRPQGDDNVPLGVIWGNDGLFNVQETWNSVTITNYSDRKLVTNLIDVVNELSAPRIEIDVDSIPGPTGGNVSESGAKSTFEFDIEHTFPKTDVQIVNRRLPGSTNGPSDIVLDGSIDNPIGRTYIRNELGDIVSDDALDHDGIESLSLDPANAAMFTKQAAGDVDIELIRTNRLELDAQQGSIGRRGRAAGADRGRTDPLP